MTKGWVTSFWEATSFLKSNWSCLLLKLIVNMYADCCWNPVLKMIQFLVLLFFSILICIRGVSLVGKTHRFFLSVLTTPKSLVPGLDVPELLWRLPIIISFLPSWYNLELESCHAIDDWWYICLLWWKYWMNMSAQLKLSTRYPVFFVCVYSIV
jgi:hypothetical protein